MLKKILTVLAYFAASACTSTSENQTAAPTVDEVALELLGSQKTTSCRFVGETLTIPARIDNAKLQWPEKNPQLIYQGAFRDSIKTVLQPLTSEFEIRNDGIVVGPKKEPQVVDFSLTNDVSNHTWATYRARSEETLSYSAYVELVKDGKMQRFKLPVDSKRSVEKVWFFAPTQRTPAVAITRSGTTEFTSKNDDAYLFDWFNVTTAGGVVKAGQFNDKENAWSSIEFDLVAGEPIAFAIKQKLRDEEVTNLRFQSSKFSLVLKRLFSPSLEETILFESNTALTTPLLAGTNTNQPSTLLSFIQEAGDEGTTTLHWALLKHSYSLFSHKKAYTPFVYANKQILKYAPASLRFRHVSDKKGSPKEVHLSWSAQLEDGIAHVSTLAYPFLGESTAQKRELKTVLVNNTTGRLVGFGDAPRVGMPDFLIVATQKEKGAPATLLRFCKF